MRFRSAPKASGFATARPPAGRAPRFAGRRRSKVSRPNLEGLEDRCLLSFSPASSYLVGLDAQAMLITQSLTPTAIKDRLIRLGLGI